MGATPSMIVGAVIDIDYLNKGESAYIRLTVKGKDGKSYEIFDKSFKPYFYLVPNKRIADEDILAVSALADNNKLVKAESLERESKLIFGKRVDAVKVYAKNPSHVPKLSSALSQYGTCYENDIPFAKRYSVDRDIIPMTNYEIEIRQEDGLTALERFGALIDEDVQPNVMCFDIESYNPRGLPRMDKDPVIMLSYSVVNSKGSKRGVITYKKIDKDFVTVVQDEKALFKRFQELLNELDIDVVVGYNSANFDIKYLLERSHALRIEFDMSRFEGSTRIERHGLVDKVKIGGRAHIDMYLVVKFISVVGAAEHILKLNSYTLKNVYEAITKDNKYAVEKGSIYKMWDGSKEELESLATYSLADADALQKVYDTFMPIMIETSRVTHNPISDTSVSTTGQLVEFMLMRYCSHVHDIIPNKPTEYEIRERLMNPIEGAYVKTPEPGIYDNLAMFDFRGLYPSIMISYNIDPSSVCNDCTEYHESPIGTKFRKTPLGITPTILKQLIAQRAEVKKAYKKDPNNIYLGSRSQALKIISNSVFGYLGYARSRWYSRECAGSITAYGRQYIKDVMSEAEKHGIKVTYGDTDSVAMLLGDKTKEDAIKFVREYNSKLPESMELELEDFYTRGVFVGKKTDKEAAGAKKKYALISESGRIKIRGFELVRRDWSRVARDTQRRVLEIILKEGDKDKAAAAVRQVITDLKEGKVPISDVVINTQIRKGIDSYDIASPEIAAARKAVKAGFKTKDEVERSVIGYVITKKGSSISDKAYLEGMAQDYDPDYYINKQVLPATMRILKELNFNEEELKGLGTQKKL